MTKGQLITDLKNMLGPGVDVDSTGLTYWLNDACMYICDEISKVNPDFFTKSSVTSTVSGQQEYTLPTDFEKMLMVNLSLGGTWRRVTPLPNINSIPVAQNVSNYTLTDYHYYIIGDEIGFSMPITETTVNNIKIWYVYTPAELSADSDEPPFPKKYHHLLKYAAMANYMNRDGNHQEAELLRKRFESRVAELVETMDSNQVDEPKSIQVTGSYDLYYNDEQDV